MLKANRENENYRYLPKRITRQDLIDRILKECKDHLYMESELHDLITDDLIIIYYAYRMEEYEWKS